MTMLVNKHNYELVKLASVYAVPDNKCCIK